MPPRKNKQGKEPKSAVVVNVPKGSLLEELILSGRERRHPPAEQTPNIKQQQTPDRAADSSSASITQTPADQHTDNVRD